MSQNSVAPLNEDALSPDLRASLYRKGEEEAEHVHGVLTALGLQPSVKGRPLALPRNFLLELGAAMQLQIWEHRGIKNHRDAGLPSPQRALMNAAYWLRAAVGLALEPPPELLSPKVAALFMEHFAWNGPATLGVDVALQKPDDDAILEALADFLWGSRAS